MRVVKTFTLTQEVVEKLAGVSNKSGLINDLLSEHFRRTEMGDLTEEELLLELKRAKLTKEFKLKLEELNYGN